MYDLSAIKQKITCVQYARNNGIPIIRSGDRCKSPLRVDSKNRSSFVVYDAFWYDFGTSSGGDVIDLCAELKHAGDRKQAIHELALLAGLKSATEYGDWKSNTQNLCNQAAYYHANLTPDDREYLHSRAITDETINTLLIGSHDGRIYIPFFKNSYVYSFISRGENPKYKHSKRDQFYDPAPWGMDSLKRESDVLYIAEGTFDALSLWQAGVPVIATMGGSFSRDTLPMVLDICRRFKRVILTFDSDTAGREFTFKLGTTLFNNRIPFSVAAMPEPHKDVSDYYAATKSIEFNTTDGMLYLAQNHTDRDAFKKFAFKLARSVDRATVADIFEKIDVEKFGKAWLGEIRKSIYNPPPEPVIVSEILSKHKLMYVDNVGFYEYKYGAWQYLSDQIIHGYISDTLGTFASGNKLTPIKNLMKPEILSTEPFDRKRVINFINGTLHLDTGEFKPHSPDDYCSIQLKYPYDPDARCPQWETFVEQVSNYNPKRMEMLQFIAGYVLVPDCRYQKIFVLLGDGGNGKSVYLELLQRVFGPENCSNVDPLGMTEAFERIYLKDSLLNLGSEISGDFSKAEQIIKKVSAGEECMACYKGKDNVKFFPRCKLIFACNEQPKSSTVRGMDRRLMFIEFECTFKDDPDDGDPTQFKRDVNIIPKLTTELSGIFNWVYSGYRDLLTVNGFTETDEHTEVMQVYKEVSDPISVFCDDYVWEGRMSRTEIYQKYCDWCLNTGHMKRTRENFFPAFRAVMKKRIISEKQVRTGRTIERYFVFSEEPEEVVPDEIFTQGRIVE